MLAGFVLGLSTGKLGEVLLGLLWLPGQSDDGEPGGEDPRPGGRGVPGPPLKGRYKALMLDGVVLARKTGAGRCAARFWWLWGVRHDGNHRVARQSAAEWERFLADLYKRGLTGEGLDMFCVHGGSGLIAALPMVYDKIPVQRYSNLLALTQNS